MKVERRHRSRFAVEMAIVLVVKLAALALIWSVWFAHPQAPRLDAEQVASALYSSQPAVQERTEPHAEP